MVFKKRENILFMVMGMVVVFLFLFFITSPLASAVEYKTIKSGWFEHGEVFVVDNKIYEVFIHPAFIGMQEPTSVILRVDNYSISTSLGNCNVKEGFEFCYMNVSFDKKMSVVNDNLVPGIEVSIAKEEDESSQLSNDLAVSSSIDKTNFMLEERSAKIILENNGDFNIYNAKLYLTFPSNFSVTNREDFTRFAYNKLEKSFTARKGELEELEFSYKLLSEGTFKLEYEIMLEDKVLKSGSISTKAVYPFDVTITVPEESDIRKSHAFKVDIVNNHPDKNLLINELLIKGPVNFQYYSSPNFDSQTLGEFGSSDVIISPEATKSYSFRFKPLFADDYSFDVLGDFDLNGNFLYAESEDLEVINEGFSAGLLFSRKTISLDSNNNLVLTLKNDHSSLEFEDIEAVITSDLFNVTKQLGSISTGSTVKLIDEKLDVPQVEENREYVANASISFINEVGQRETIELSDSFKVLGNASLVRISQKPSVRKVEAGDEVIVEVNLKNLVDNSIPSVFVDESFSQNVDIITGSRSAEFFLSPAEDKGVYIYKIKIPQKPYSDELVINTTVTIPSLNYETSASTTIRVDGEIYDELKPDESTTGNVSDGEKADDDSSNDDDSADEELSDDEEADEEDDDKKDEVELSFLRRLVNSIENFFSSIF